MYSNVKKNVGGFAFVFLWMTNSSGTLAKASTPKKTDSMVVLKLFSWHKPKICSLGIHPSTFIKSNQWLMISNSISRSQAAIKSPWKPSSQRKPLGKKLLRMYRIANWNRYKICWQTSKVRPYTMAPSSKELVLWCTRSVLWNSHKNNRFLQACCWGLPERRSFHSHHNYGEKLHTSDSKLEFLTLPLLA